MRHRNRRVVKWKHFQVLPKPGERGRAVAQAVARPRAAKRMAFHGASAPGVLSMPARNPKKHRPYLEAPARRRGPGPPEPNPENPLSLDQPQQNTGSALGIAAR